MKQYSVDLRERLLVAIDAGLSQAEASRLVGVGTSTITRWRQQRRDTGRLTSKRRTGRPPRIGPADAAGLRRQVARHPDATLAEHCRHWARSANVAVSVPTMSRAIRRLGITRKKVLRAAEQDPLRPAAWWAALDGSDPAALVFVDESGTNLAMTPRSGRAPRGERVVGVVPRNHGPTTTLVAAMGLEGITAAMTVEGVMERRAFDAFVAQVLVPRLQPGQVVVWDTLSVHKSDDARRPIEARLPVPVAAAVLPGLHADRTGLQHAQDRLASHRSANP